MISEKDKNKSQIVEYIWEKIIYQKNEYSFLLCYEQIKNFQKLFINIDNKSLIYLMLGNLYYNGYGVKQDYLKAKKYYELSSKLNNSTALLNLGDLYYKGYGVRQDYFKAKKCYELSSKLNNPTALFNLGNLYYDGYGVKQDYFEAKKYYAESAKLKNSSAFFKLGHLYANGYGVNQDDFKANEYYKQFFNIKSSKNNFNILTDNPYNYIKAMIQNFSMFIKYYDIHLNRKKKKH